MRGTIRRRSEPASEVTPGYLSRSELGKKLYKLMTEKGWNQSDLCRAAFGVDPKTGYPRGRDGLSKYIRGITRPHPRTLAKIAAALGVSVDDIMPREMLDRMSGEIPTFSIQAVPGRAGVVWLQISRTCSAAAAGKILSILNDEDG